MDHHRLITIVQQFPQVWDRNSATFREPSLKNEAWERIAELMSSPSRVCKDAFKSIREKYIREREKQTQFADKYIPWRFLNELSFLDPHIILRRQSNISDKATTSSTQAYIEPQVQYSVSNNQDNYSDFDKTLIALVRKATPIWDRKSNGYPSKQVKLQLWKNIAEAINKDLNVCMSRWKGLREKYIRQKNKMQEGDVKWEFHDDMAFLDGVIQYRRKNCNEFDYYYSGRSEQDSAGKDEQFDDSISSSDYNVRIVKSEDFDSSYDSATSTVIGTSLKRTTEAPNEPAKKLHVESPANIDYYQKTPEQMFGELIAAMLTRKSERDKNVAMIEIMKILTK